jgi:hypothetical protein
LAVDLFQKMTKPRPNFDRPRPRRSDGPQEGMVAVLKQCGDDLTRENVLKQAANIHDLKLPMLLPGITVSTSAHDFAPIKQMQLTKFDGNNWVTFGELISAVGN